MFLFVFDNCNFYDLRVEDVLASVPFLNSYSTSFAAIFSCGQALKYHLFFSNHQMFVSLFCPDSAKMLMVAKYNVGVGPV